LTNRVPQNRPLPEFGGLDNCQSALLECRVLPHQLWRRFLVRGSGMSGYDAISRARQWAVQHRIRLQPDCSHHLVDERSNEPPAHWGVGVGWWLLFFGEPEVLDGDGTIIFVHDATGEVKMLDKKWWQPGP